LRTGETLLLCDGRGNTGYGVVTAVGRGTLDVKLTRRTYEPPSDPRIVAVQGIAKADRGELAVQAMTEVGVDAIVAWSASRSVVQWHAERGERSRRRWVDTAREAAKQSRRSWFPEVVAQESTVAVAARIQVSAGALVLHEEARLPLTTVELPGAGEIVLVIGPEGGVTPEELAVFEAAGARAVRLGPTVLRTSTAGVAAIAVLSARLHRW
jgi:16S rRNA (uracil1498-N3)-methyltransferase